MIQNLLVKQFSHHNNTFFGDDPPSQGDDFWCQATSMGLFSKVLQQPVMPPCQRGASSGETLDLSNPNPYPNRIHWKVYIIHMSVYIYNMYSSYIGWFPVNVPRHSEQIIEIRKKFIVSMGVNRKEWLCSNNGNSQKTWERTKSAILTSKKREESC